MKYYDYNNDLNIIVPLLDEGAVIGSLIGVASFTVILSAGNNRAITITYDGTDIAEPEGVSVMLTGGVLNILIDAQTIQSSLGTGVITASGVVNFTASGYPGGVRTSTFTQSTNIMLVDGDAGGETPDVPVPQSIGTLTITMGSSTLGTYNGTTTTIDIPESGGGSSFIVDNDTIVSDSSVLRVAVGIKGASFSYDPASHSVLLSQGSYNYAASIPYASQSNGGLVNTYVQTFSGRKLFKDGICIGDCVLLWDAATSSLVLSNAVTGEVVNLKMSGTIVQNYSAPVLQLLPADQSLSTDSITTVSTTIIVKAENVADDATINLALTGSTTGFSVSPTSVTGASAKSAQGATVTFAFDPTRVDQTVQDVRDFVTVVTASITGGPSAQAQIETEADFSPSV